MWHVFNSLVLALGLHSSSEVLWCSSLVVLFLGFSSLIVGWELLSCCIMLCCSSLGAVCWLISICHLSGYSLVLKWILLSRCGVQDRYSLGAEYRSSFLHAVSCLAPLLLQCWAPPKLWWGTPIELHWGTCCSSQVEVGPPLEFFGGLLLSSSSVQGCFCLILMCGWLNYLWHGAPL